MTTSNRYDTLFQGAAMAMSIWNTGKPWDHIPDWLAHAMKDGDDVARFWNSSFGEDGFRIPPELWGDARVYADGVVYRRYYYDDAAGFPRVIVTAGRMDGSPDEFVIGEWRKNRYSVEKSKEVVIYRASDILSDLLGLQSIFLGDRFAGKITGAEAVELVREVVRGVAQKYQPGAVFYSSFPEHEKQTDVVELVAGLTGAGK